MSNLPWKASQFQAVWFSQSITNQLVADKVFQALFAIEPVTIQVNRMPNGGSSSNAAGVLDGADVQVVTQPGRLDVLSRVSASMPFASSLFELDAALAPFTAKLQSFTGVEDCIRMALVITLHQVAKNPAQAAAIVNQAIGGVVPFEDSTDLNFQVNRRRLMGFNDNVAMNRLVRFTVETIQEFQVAAGPTGGLALPGGSDTVVATQTLDLNIVPTRRTFGAEEQIKIWSEFADEARRLARAGSVNALKD